MSLVTQGYGSSGLLILQGYGFVGPVGVPTLIVEDGTGRVDAESFCSVAFADDYFLRRLNTSWSALAQATKESCLRQASDFMEQEYRMRWAGYKRTAEQALSWPRWEVYYPDVGYGYYGWAGFVGFDTVPDLIKKACAELAIRAHNGKLSIDTGRLKERVRIGGISGVDVTYAKSSTDQNTYFTSVEAYLRPFLESWSSPGRAHSVKLERA